MIFVKLGIRNIARNKRRSFLTALAIGVGLAAMIITDGFMEGMIQNMIKTATSGLLGHGQIHHSRYVKSPESEFVIQGHKKIESLLNADSKVISWTKRAQSLGMIASPRNSRNISIYGIDTLTETKTTGFIKYLKDGVFLKEDNHIVIGTKLMKKLGVDLGDKVVLTTSEVKTGELTQDVFRVGGVISFGSDRGDSSLAFVKISKLQTMLGIKDQYHEIVLNLGGPFQSPVQIDKFWSNLEIDGNLARRWSTLSPALSSAIKMSSFSVMIIGSIMAILMALLTTNTLFMAIFERLFEFGVVRALGTDNRHLITMVASESAALGFLSSIVGMIVALIFGGWMAIQGIDYGGVEFNNITFREPIYFIFRWHQWVVFPILTIVFTCFVGLYPAIFTTRLNIAHALKKSL